MAMNGARSVGRGAMGWGAVAIGALAVFVSGGASAQTKAEKQALALLSRLPAQIEPLIKVTGDDLDTRITVSSHGATAIVTKGLIASTTSENSFLRAYVDKKTGEVRAQIYHIATYGGRGWHFFTRATYQTVDGVKEVDAARIGSDVNCYRYGCTHYEDIGVPVEYTELQAAAARYNPAEPATGLRYRLFGKSGETIDEVVPGNEIVAFVAVVERARSRLAPK